MADMVVCGVINWDVMLFVDNLPAAGEEVQVKKLISVPGGKGANTAVAAARVLGSAARVGIIGMLGADEVATKQIKILEQEGIDTSCITIDDRTGSGQAFVVIDSRGEDMILTHRAANQMIAPEHILRSQNVASALQEAAMVIIIDPPLEVACTLIQQVRNRRKNRKKKESSNNNNDNNDNDAATIIWSPALLTRHGFSTLYEYLSSVDYVILNEQEAKTLAASPADDYDGVRACMKISDALDGKKVVTTLGSRGCIFCEGGKRVMIPTVDVNASFGLRTISTAGAGDTFVGTFGAFKLKGFDDIESLFLANLAAALKTTREEVRGSPDYKEIKRYMNQVRSLYKSIKII